MRKIIAIFVILIGLSCSYSQDVNESDIQSAEIVTIKGCEVLIVKSKTQVGDWGYGFMGMTKVDCNCIFQK